VSDRRASGAFTDQSFHRPYKCKNQSFHSKDTHKTKIAASLRKTGVTHSRLFSVTILIGNLWILEKSLNSLPPSLKVHYSVADQLPPGTPLIRHRPFGAPHRTISHAGLVGGGNIPKPGEISLAQSGVLFLDEFPEFGTRVLEVMLQPMEDKVVTISRAKGSLTFSANFQLIAAMNPCPCGFYGDSQKPW
jgi:Magnesium chelatase, subunit ChlI